MTHKFHGDIKNSTNSLIVSTTDLRQPSSFHAIPPPFRVRNLPPPLIFPENTLTYRGSSTKNAQHSSLHTSHGTVRSTFSITLHRPRAGSTLSQFLKLNPWKAPQRRPWQWGSFVPEVLPWQSSSSLLEKKWWRTEAMHKISDADRILSRPLSCCTWSKYPFCGRGGCLHLWYPKNRANYFLVHFSQENWLL